MIYHITDTALWEKALAGEFYRHPSLKEEGFIHCSSKDQLGPTADRYFAGVDEIIVLSIVERRIPGQVKWEMADSVTPPQEFPHIYGPLPLDAIEDVSIITRVNGAWDWSDLGKGL
jgi:uncharacterized protein (DUF952 family)